MPTPKQQRRRALELLEASIDGCTEAIMLAYGFKTELLVELVDAGFATASIVRMVAGGGPYTSDTAAMGTTTTWSRTWKLLRPSSFQRDEQEARRCGIGLRSSEDPSFRLNPHSRDLDRASAGDVLHDAFAVRCPSIDAEGKVSSQRAHLLPHSSSSSRYTAGGWVKHSPPKRLRNASAVAASGKQNRI